jgi:hypothetical protein
MPERAWGIGGLVFAVAVTTGYFIARRLWTPWHPRVAVTAAIQAEAPHIVPIGAPMAVPIEPREYRDYAIRIPARTCGFEATVLGLTGGHRDFEGWLLTEAEYRDWQESGHSAGMHSGRVTRWNPRTTLQGPETFHLLVSNGFSVVTTKEVRVEGRAVCAA